MDVKFTHFPAKKIRAFLVFFCFAILCISCTEQTVWQQVNYDEEGRAQSISFTSKEDLGSFALYLEGQRETAVLGTYTALDDTIVFKPTIPLSKGLIYKLFTGSKAIYSFKIESLTKNKVPSITQIHPSKDTVPENLLKLYVQFSESMQETGNVLDFVQVFNTTKQQEEQVFLELQSELWNKEHTLLTLWLDPGRIKTDLIPNREKGLPLQAGNKYQIRFSKEWKSALGVSLGQDYVKTLMVTTSDRTKPNTETWSIQTPIKNTIHPLNIGFPEPLDAVLCMESIYITNAQGEIVQGSFELLANEEGISFIPKRVWIKGSYQIQVLPKLEDLSGNNLSHLFDEEVNGKSNTQIASASYTRSFSILH